MYRYVSRNLIRCNNYVLNFKIYQIIKIYVQKHYTLQDMIEGFRENLKWPSCKSVWPIVEALCGGREWVAEAAVLSILNNWS